MDGLLFGMKSYVDLDKEMKQTLRVESIYSAKNIIYEIGFRAVIIRL